ncbi:hypothetical protein FFB58_19915 [Enterobacter sp. MF024]|uniref:hypothetical protein n=1 Tax=Enterobacter sp. MF024 TaxID=2555644 RepID=UPI001106B8C7|nr:hypothetical protein [Enterobacter sp. MF024]TLU63960.1 hypothetical protein FFB58_19915 [Enterobacter sp. MF024]
MKVSETALLESGLSHADLQKIKNNVDNYCGSLDESIHDLANRFRIVLWVFFCCMAVFIWVMVSNNTAYVISTDTGLLISMLIVVFVQPPVLAYKSWRYYRIHRTHDNHDR